MKEMVILTPHLFLYLEASVISYGRVEAEFNFR
jgi:hypothetical protein